MKRKCSCVARPVLQDQNVDNFPILAASIERGSWCIHTPSNGFESIHHGSATGSLSYHVVNQTYHTDAARQAGGGSGSHIGRELNTCR